MTVLLGFIGSMAYSESGKICYLSLLNSHSLIMVYQGYAVCLMRLTSHIKYQCQTDKYLSFRNPMMNTYCATEAVFVTVLGSLDPAKISFHFILHTLYL